MIFEGENEGCQIEEQKGHIYNKIGGIMVIL